MADGRILALRHLANPRISAGRRPRPKGREDAVDMKQPKGSKRRRGKPVLRHDGGKRVTALVAECRGVVRTADAEAVHHHQKYPFIHIRHRPYYQFLSL